MNKYQKYIIESKIDEGKYAKYLEATERAKREKKKKITLRSDMIKEYEEKVRTLKQMLAEINKKMDAHIKKQRKDPTNKLYIVEVNSYIKLLDDVLDEMDILRQLEKGKL